MHICIYKCVYILNKQYQQLYKHKYKLLNSYNKYLKHLIPLTINNNTFKNIKFK